MPRKRKKIKSLYGLFKGMKISEEEIRKAQWRRCDEELKRAMKKRKEEFDLDKELEKQAKKAPGIEKIWEITKDLPSFSRLILEERGYCYEECQHEWVWYPDETSTWKWAGYWRCRKCGLFKY